MKRAIAGTALMMLAPFLAHGQVADPHPVFEVASIKPSAPPAPGGPMRMGTSGGPGSPDPGRFTTMNFSLRDLVISAYGIKRYQLTAPAWLDSERFDINAKVPQGATREQFQLMLQNLLAERFKLAVHHETKEMQMYELVVAKNGPKLKEAAEIPAPKDTAPQQGPPPSLPPRPTMGPDGFPVLPAGARGPMMIMMNGRARWQVSPGSMDQLTNMLANQVDRPVTDATGLKAKYDMSLYWSPQPGMGIMGRGAPMPPPLEGGGPTPVAPDGDAGPTIFGAIQEQLGLKLEQKKGPVDIVVVDHIEKVPTEN